MSRPSRLAIMAIAVVSLVLLAAFSCGKEKPAPEVKLGSPAPGITITIPPPGQAPPQIGQGALADIPGGAPGASLQQAAVFAWQEFISATWPAQPNGTTYNRDVPDPNGIYGATAGSASGAPLVWETFRHKVEIFPGTTAANYMQQAPPHGLNLSAPDLGYNDPPQYNYATYPSTVVSGACPGTTPAASTPWVNADENSQIFLDTMYAGVNNPTGPQPGSDQELLFLAKGNHVQFQYVVNPKNFGSANVYDGIWNHFGPGVTGETSTPIYTTAVSNFATYQTAVLANVYSGGPPAPPLTAPYVSFPPGTVEAKSAWRPLTSAESGPCLANQPTCRFHMAVIRHYQSVANNGSAPFCYVDQPWGMMALHIIQKTPSAPYFIYATFSQADNILTASGQPVEDANGNMIVQNPGPNLDSGLSTPGQNPIQANLATPTQYETYNTMTAQCKAQSRLYLVNSAGQYTPQGPICVNQRTHPIPSTIISVNQAAHAAITAYNNQYNAGKPNPWLAYKLINVQSMPMTKTPGVLYTGADSATFYQSNDVVETNYNLQFFSGRLVTNPSYGQLMSDYNAGPTPPATTQFLNTFFLKTPNGSSVATYNMGGCMGCHGNAQQAGDDFSFILNVGRNDAPEPLPSAGTMSAQPAAVAAKVKKFHLPG
jgi:hypothetical protein